MGDGEYLLRAILDEPGADVHRLAYADWLEDDGQSSFAAFIRLWLAHPTKRLRDVPADKISYWSPDGGDAVRYDLAVPTGCESATWRRGFVESVGCTLDAWQEYGPAIARAHPIESLTLTDRRPTRFHATPARPGEYGWCQDSHAGGASETTPDNVPDEVFAAMPGAVGPNEFWKFYPSAGAAYFAFVLWARAQSQPAIV